MPIIERIGFRNIGIFENIKWPDDLKEYGFGKCNLIYGWNGSGKTTLSRALRSFESQRFYDGKSLIYINDKDFEKSNVRIRVFNKDLVNESIFPINGDDLPPIFVIGEESVKKQKILDDLKQQQSTTQSELQSAQASHATAEKAFNRHCQQQARIIKDTLRSTGQNIFNNYNKSQFRDRATQMVADGNASLYCLNDIDRNLLHAQLRGTPKPTILEVKFQPPALQQLANTTSALLERTVVSAAIQSLKDNPRLGEWTRDGLNLHKQQQAEICLFCEQQLPERRLSALEAHFSTEYEQFMQEINEQTINLGLILDKISELNLPNRAELYDDMADKYDVLRGSFLQAIANLRSFVESLIDSLEKKKVKAFDRLAVSATVPTFNVEIIGQLNQIIREHNQASTNFQGRAASARDRLALDLIATDIDEFMRLQNEILQALTKKETAENRLDDLTARIRNIEQDILEHHRPAHELNHDLHAYLGHDEFQFAIKDIGYSITRNGHPANMLSEGEQTAIALLYFLKSLEDMHFDNKDKEGVVVLDDPVSSLDSNAMYSAFGFIKDRTKHVSQLFILTHNFTFFRQCFRGLCQQDDLRSYMIKCYNNNGRRVAKLSKIDPLLEKYESEYHYLFACVYHNANASSTNDLEQYYHMPNVARRMLETFLSFRRPNEKNLLTMMNNLNFKDSAKKNRIIRFVHRYSHADSIGQQEHDPYVLNECQEVMKNILELIKNEDPGHYSEMKRLVERYQTR